MAPSQDEAKKQDSAIQGDEFALGNGGVGEGPDHPSPVLSEAERRLQIIAKLPVIKRIEYIVTAGVVMQGIAKEYFGDKSDPVRISVSPSGATDSPQNKCPKCGSAGYPNCIKPVHAGLHVLPAYPGCIPCDDEWHKGNATPSPEPAQSQPMFKGVPTIEDAPADWPRFEHGEYLYALGPDYQIAVLGEPAQRKEADDLLGEMVRDFCSLSRPKVKSEVRRRILAYCAQVTAQRDAQIAGLETVAKCWKETAAFHTKRAEKAEQTVAQRDARIAELEKELRRWHALDEHLPPGYAVGDDATAELAVKLVEAEQRALDAERERNRCVEFLKQWRELHPWWSWKRYVRAE